MPSNFMMQIRNKRTGEVVEFEPGLSVEVNFVDACVQKILDNSVDLILSKGVGLFRTSSHVKRDIQDGLEESVRDSIEEVIQDLKSQVKPKST